VIVSALTDCLWYVDGHTSSMESRSCRIPEEFKQFTGYNVPEKSKHRRRESGNMCATTLDNLSSVLNKFLLQPWFLNAVWKMMKPTVTSLVDAIAKYAHYLKEKNIEVTANHNKVVPVRSASEAESFFYIKKSSWVKPILAVKFKALEDHLESVQPFVPFLLNDLTPGDSR